MQQLDTLPYKAFKYMRDTKGYPAKMILITDADMSMPGLRRAFKDHQDYVKHLFAKEGIEVYRMSHNYKSIESGHPELGLVYLANDSVINPGMEVWCLIGHNARYMEKKAEARDGL